MPFQSQVNIDTADIQTTTERRAACSCQTVKQPLPQKTTLKPSGFFILLPLAFKPNFLKFTFHKKEKLKSKKLIEQLFENGQSVSAFPLRLVYLQTTFEDAVIAKTGVSVSKRNFKTAIARNRIKRLLREVYRLNKATYFNNITTQYAFMILYIGKDIPTLAQVETRMNQLFEKFLKKVSETEKLHSDEKTT